MEYKMSISGQKTVVAAMVLVILCIVSTGTVLTGYLIDMDKSLMLALTFREHTCLDMFWYHYSRLSTWLPLVLVLLVTIWLCHGGSVRRKVLLFLSIALLVLLLDQVSSGLIKPLVERLRPSHDESICHSLRYVNGYRGGRYGFVSGHATNIVGIVTWLCYMFRTYMARLLFVTFAVTLCYSRIYLGVHFPGDIVCGALLGFVIARCGVVPLRRYGIMFTTDRQPWFVLAAYLLTVAVLLTVTFVR